jgi:hypothetical protein
MLIRFQITYQSSNWHFTAIALRLNWDFTINLSLSQIEQEIEKLNQLYIQLLKFDLIFAVLDGYIIRKMRKEGRKR